MTIAVPVTPYLLLLGLGFFFGLAFEEFNVKGGVRPGGVRTFPLLALVGALLYQLDPARLVPLTAGLVVLGAWLCCFYWRHLGETDPEGQPNAGLMSPVCNLLAYLLGPVSFAEPPWVAIGATVTAVLLLTARERLHGFARRLEMAEIVTAGKFLILTGLILPFLPDTPVTALVPLTPRQVWLAVLAICTVSYASYWRYVVGTFQVKIPVSYDDVLLLPEENTLAIMKWRLLQTPPGSRWYPVLIRYVEYLSGRVNAFHGNAGSILPSPTGVPVPKGGGGGGKGSHGAHNEEFTGKVESVAYDRFGDFEGFHLLTEFGHHREFRSREAEIERLVRFAWADRVVISVRVGRRHLEHPVSIILRRVPIL